MRVWNVLFEKAQRGWHCTITFTHETANQFTEEIEAVRCGARYWWWAYICARRAARATHELLRAKPGERAAKGWAD